MTTGETMKLSIVSTAILLLVSCSSSPPAPEFPDTVQIEGHTLHLQGHGVRVNNWGEIYYGGLWLTTPSSKPAEIIAADEPKRLSWNWIIAVDAAPIVESFGAAFSYHFPREKLNAMRERLDRFNAVWDGGVKKGTKTTFTYLPERGTVVAHDGTEVGVIEGRDFMTVFWTAILGPKRVINPEFAKSLLGLSPEEEVEEAQIAGLSTPSPASANYDVRRKAVDLYSDGTRIAGDLFWPKAQKEGERLPAILMAQGWAGAKKQLAREYAPKFASAGFVVMTIDYRGWGESDCKLMLTGKMSTPDPETGAVTVAAKPIRQVIDPFDQIEDLKAAVDFLMGDPMVDPERIGIWGSSFGGGHAVYMAATDERIKCAISQVGSQGGKNLGRLFQDKGGDSYFYKVAAQRARGERHPIPQDGEDKYIELPGTPNVWHIFRYRPREVAHQINVPLLILDAEKEHNFKIEEHGGRVYEIVKANSSAPVERIILPNASHAVAYGPRFEEVSDIEIKWFTQHL